MKSTGIVRKIDELGRIVLPIEMRRTLEIAERDPLEIYVEGSSIILKKYIPEKARKNRKYVCAKCGEEIDEADVEAHIAKPAPVKRTTTRAKKDSEEE
jgi:transcriptional pleiotropic regulator of transition state genes